MPGLLDGPPLTVPALPRFGSGFALRYCCQNAPFCSALVCSTRVWLLPLGRVTVCGSRWFALPGSLHRSFFPHTRDTLSGRWFDNAAFPHTRTTLCTRYCLAFLRAARSWFRFAPPVSFRLFVFVLRADTMPRSVPTHAGLYLLLVWVLTRDTRVNTPHLPTAAFTLRSPFYYTATPITCPTPRCLHVAFDHVWSRLPHTRASV